MSVSERGHLVIAIVFVIAVGLLLLLPYARLTGFASFTTSGQSDFDAGTYQNVSFNGSAVVLYGSNLTGSYTSKVFASTDLSRWDNVSWVFGGSSPLFFVRVCDDSACLGDSWNRILISTPATFSLVNRTYFQYRADFSRTSLSDETALYNVSVGYTLTNASPLVSIIQPQHGSTYGSNISFALSFSASDTSLRSCWYSLNFGVTNISLPDCQNTTIPLPFNNHTLAVYANDSEGLIGSAQSNFTIAENFSTLYLVSPPLGYISNVSLSPLVYFANDTDLAQCNLLTDFAGAWGTSATNLSLENGTNQFLVTIETDGPYLWGIECFDASGLTTRSANRTLSLDTVVPSITLSNPVGTFSSRESIPLALSVSDASTVTCIYTLTKVGAGTVLVVVMPQCASTNFNVAQDGDYQLLVSVTDSSGNSGQSSTSFSVGSSGSSQSSGSSGGGGGGGGVSVDVSALVLPKLGYEDLPELSIRPGYSVNLTINLVNQGNRFLNNCTLEGSGIYRDWVQDSGLVSLSSGERRSYAFSLSLPRSLSAGRHVIGLVASCNELDTSIPFPIEVIPAEFDFSFDSYARVASQLQVNYTLEDLTGIGGRASVHYSLLNSESIELSSGISYVELAPGVKQPFSLLLDLPKDSFGEFILVLQVSSGADSIESRQEIFLSGSTLTGFAISNRNKRVLSTWGVGIFFFVLALFLFRYLRVRWKRESDSVSPSVS